MSGSGRRMFAERERAKAEAQAQNVRKVLMDLGSNPSIMSGGAEDSGNIDELKNTDMPADILFPYMYARMRGDRHSRAWDEVACYLERGLPSIDGKRAKLQSQIAMSLGGGGRSRNLARNGFVDRHFRHKPEFREEDVEDEED